MMTNKLQHCKTGEIINLPELIPLQSLHVTQHNNGGVKSDWSVEENITNDRLHTLPARLNEAEVFSITKFAKKYELEAFNKGIDFQKTKQNEYLKSVIKELQFNNDNLAKENVRLANILEKLLPEE